MACRTSLSGSRNGGRGRWTPASCRATPGNGPSAFLVQASPATCLQEADRVENCRDFVLPTRSPRRREHSDQKAAACSAAYNARRPAACTENAKGPLPGCRLTLLASLFAYCPPRWLVRFLNDAARPADFLAVIASMGAVQIRVTRETWSRLVGAALATFRVTHKPPVLNHAAAATWTKPFANRVSRRTARRAGSFSSRAAKSTCPNVDRRRYAVRSMASRYLVAAMNRRVVPGPPKAQLAQTEGVGM
jgi:hypothetical protein